MILVINLNASVDKRYELTELTKGEVMRAKTVDNTPGGKGLHVANVDTILGLDTVVTGFVGGFSGEFIVNKTNDYGIKNDFVKVAGETRSCLAIITADGAQTEILEPGPVISSTELAAFQAKYTELLPCAEVVVASGSVPQGVPKDFYAKLIAEAKAAGKKFLLDTSGALLENGIKAKPFFIKPNKDEIKALKGANVESEADVIREVKGFLADGVQLAVVSLGAAGSIAGFKDKIYRVTVPKIECKNPVGSGDSFVAGVAAGLAKNLAISEVLKLGAACGTSNAMEEESGFVRKEIVEELIAKIKVKEI